MVDVEIVGNETFQKIVREIRTGIGMDDLVDDLVLRRIPPAQELSGGIIVIRPEDKLVIRFNGKPGPEELRHARDYFTKFFEREVAVVSGDIEIFAIRPDDRDYDHA